MSSASSSSPLSGPSAPTSVAAGYGFALLAASLWAVLGPLSRFCFADGIEPLEVAFWRAVIGGICFSVHGLLRGEMSVKPSHGVIFCLFGLVGVALLFGSYQTSVAKSGAALAAVLLYTAPAWVAVFSRLLFREPLTGRKLTALGVAMLGTVLVCLAGGSTESGPSIAGIACGLAAGLFYATHYPFYAWWRDRYNTSTLYAFMLLAGAVALYPFLPVSPFAAKSPATWTALLCLGVFCTYGAFLAYGAGMRRISPVRAAVVSNLEPVLATLLAWLWWGELFPPLGWVGGFCVLTAVFILTTEQR